jgi:SAM-dependent methyltransferase
VSMAQEKPFAPSAERNREPLRDVLKKVLTGSGLLLEIGSGTGQHAAYLAQDFPAYQWQPTDLPEKLDTIDAWAADSDAENILPAIALDLAADPSKEDWPVQQCDALVCINTIHIVAWPLVVNLFRGASRALKPGGVMFVYGPFEYSDRPLEPSNAEFDEWLKLRDPNSGIRKFEDVNELAEQGGLRLEEDLAMPANNRSIWWRKV